MAKYINSWKQTKTWTQNRNQNVFSSFILTCEIQIKIYAIRTSSCDVKWNVFRENEEVTKFGSNNPYDARQQTHEASIRYVCSLFSYRSQIVKYFAFAQAMKLFPFHLIELILRFILFLWMFHHCCAAVYDVVILWI